MNFALHPRLAKGSFELGQIKGCRVLLKNNQCFPWLIIVPEVEEDIEDLHQLPWDRFQEVMQVVRQVSQFTEDFFQLEKLNFGCIGNQVRQMHLHVIARGPDDGAWPGVVWSSSLKEPYREERVAEIQAAFHAVLQDLQTV